MDVGTPGHPGWTLLDYLAHVPVDNFHLYEAACVDHPLKTKALTSCVAYTLGDFTAQTFQGRDFYTLDLKRTARSGIAARPAAVCMLNASARHISLTPC